MNDFVKDLLTVFLVYSVSAGIAVCVFSIVSRLRKKEKLTVSFVVMRFIKGFAAVALSCAFIFLDMKYGLTTGPKEYTPASTIINAVLGLVRLATPVAIIVGTHICTKAIEESLEL